MSAERQPECICAEINFRHCPIHQDADGEAEREYTRRLLEESAADWAREFDELCPLLDSSMRLVGDRARRIFAEGDGGDGA